MKDETFIRYSLIPIPLFFVGGGLWMYGIIVFPPDRTEAMLGLGIGAGLLLLIPYLILAFRKINPRQLQSSLTRMGIVATLAAVGIIPFAGGVLITANGQFDGGTAKTYSCKILGVREFRTGRRGQRTELRVRVVSWRKKGRADYLTMNAIEQADVVSGRAENLEITIKPGLLGVPWIESKKYVGKGLKTD